MAYFELFTKPRVELSIVDEIVIAIPIVAMLLLLWLIFALLTRRK